MHQRSINMNTIHIGSRAGITLNVLKQRWTYRFLYFIIEPLPEPGQPSWWGLRGVHCVGTGRSRLGRPTTATTGHTYTSPQYGVCTGNVECRLCVCVCVCVCVLQI